MVQLKQIKTGLKDLDIKPGNVVRLLQPFKPERFSSREYTFAIVAGIVEDNSKSSSKQQSCSGSQISTQEQPSWHELVVYLYEPHSSTVYTDEYSSVALFSFDLNEVEILQRG
ncbi:MAG: hypothetical protein JOZ78_05220 [Chroococcidiopsidaceae cyanobacterium CP_BM_ER_R8_30]|nr:hypothetical protein [Chroococcidiopsidaceae cyanobacterium CP_BM_ER_R8_30]